MALLAKTVAIYCRIACGMLGNAVLLIGQLAVVLPCSVLVLSLLGSILALRFSLMWCCWSSTKGSWVSWLSRVVFGRRTLVILKINCICCC